MSVSVLSTSCATIFSGTNHEVKFDSSPSQATIKITNSGGDNKIVNLDPHISGWYWGNILIGGVVGMLIIDPATGGMYTFNTENAIETLPPAGAAAQDVRIIDYNDIPENIKGDLIRL